MINDGSTSFIDYSCQTSVAPNLLPRSQQSFSCRLSTSIPWHQLCILSLCNLLLCFNHNYLNMARRGHIGVDSAMGSISTTTLFGGLVHLNVFHHKGLRIQTFRLYTSVG